MQWGSLAFFASVFFIVGAVVVWALGRLLPVRAGFWTQTIASILAAFLLAKITFAIYLSRRISRVKRRVDDMMAGFSEAEKEKYREIDELAISSVPAERERGGELWREYFRRCRENLRR
jgi:type VI protein secretion system component VasK